MNHEIFLDNFSIDSELLWRRRGHLYFLVLIVFVIFGILISLKIVYRNYYQGQFIVIDSSLIEGFIPVSEMTKIESNGFFYIGNDLFPYDNIYVTDEVQLEGGVYLQRVQIKVLLTNKYLKNQLIKIKIVKEEMTVLNYFKRMLYGGMVL